ncbi:MAG: PDZ domain-containing protein, partial [Eubacteriales bacterium]
FGAPNTDGALIGYVSSGGPAEKAGIQKGDIVIEINKKKIKTPDDVSEIVGKAKVGSSLVLQIFRDKKTQYVTLKTAEKP